MVPVPHRMTASPMSIPEYRIRAICILLRIECLNAGFMLHLLDSSQLIRNPLFTFSYYPTEPTPQYANTLLYPLTGVISNLRSQISNKFRTRRNGKTHMGKNTRNWNFRLRRRFAIFFEREVGIVAFGPYTENSDLRLIPPPRVRDHTRRWHLYEI